MTDEQRNALNRVSAAYAYANNLDIVKGTYHTVDIGLVLNLLETFAQTLVCVKDDLKMIKAYLESEPSDGFNHVLISMVESTITIVNEKELS
jgi:hypothetical protein